MSLTALGREQIAGRLYKSDVVHTPLPGPDAVDDAALAFYREHGFLAVENVIPADVIAAAMDGIAQIVHDGDPRVIQFEKSFDQTETDLAKREAGVRKVMMFVDREPRLRAVSEHPNLLAIGRKLIGTDLTLFQDMALLKPPSIGVEKPWHQDAAYFQIEPLDLILGTWTALDPALVENGCMHVIPGTHLLGPKPHYHDRDCQLPDEEVDVARDVVCPLKPGGTLFFSGLLHHGTPPNSSPLRRRALQFHYHSVDCVNMSTKQAHDHYHDDTGYAGCRSWTGQFPHRTMPERG